MATYRTIKLGFWSDPFIEGLSGAQKLLYLYLITSPHTNNLGLLEISQRRIAFECGLSETELSEILKHFASQGKLALCQGRIWLVSFIRNQCATSPKIITGLRALFAQVPDPELKARIAACYPGIFGAKAGLSQEKKVAAPENPSQGRAMQTPCIAYPEKERKRKRNMEGNLNSESLAERNLKVARKVLAQME